MKKQIAKNITKSKFQDGGWLTNCYCGIDQPHRHPEKDGKFDWKTVEMLEWESKTELMAKYGDAHGYKGVEYKGISAWINEGKKYQFWDYVDSKMLIEFRDRTHKIGKHGAVALVGKNGDICGECRKEVKKEFTDINPLKQRVYKRLEKMKLKDLADKVEEIINKLNGR